MPDLPWQGHWIEVAEDRSWSWIRCAICNRRLSDPGSIARGVGPDCLAEHDDDQVEDAKRLARLLDRDVWTGRRVLSEHGPPVKRRAQVTQPARDYFESIGERNPALQRALAAKTAEAVNRWRTFTQARERAGERPGDGSQEVRRPPAGR